MRRAILAEIGRQAGAVRILVLVLSWAVLGICAYAMFLWYVLIGNITNHTAAEPLVLLIFPISLALVAFFLKGKYRIILIVISVAMVCTTLWLDLTNGMLNYSSWINRGMPDKWEW